MKTKTSKTDKIRAALEVGESVKDIAAKFKIKPQTVYTMRWKMNQASKKRVVVKKAEAPVVDYPIEMGAYIDDLMEIRRQIDSLHTIEAFLQIRIDQMKQNAQWQTKNK